MYDAFGDAGVLGGLCEDLHERLLREIVAKLDHRAAALI